MGLKLILFCLFGSIIFENNRANNEVPVLKLDKKDERLIELNETLKFIPFIELIELDKDTSEFWKEADIISLVRQKEEEIDYDECSKVEDDETQLNIPSRRTVRPICRRSADFHLCPQCPRLNNETECELFRDSCKERRVLPTEYRTYCDNKYGKWKTMFLAADYSQCRCCDECVFYREMDQSCMADENSFEAEETLPVSRIDFRAGCNPYWGHSEQEFRALRCDRILRRCVPISVPALPNDTLYIRRNFRYKPLPDTKDCPLSCTGYQCESGFVKEQYCTPGAFLPEKDQCNCCGKCSFYFQLNQKCAEFKETIHRINETEEIEVEEEFLEPGCDDGLVCREGICQDIHAVDSVAFTSAGRKLIEKEEEAYEPCRQELRYFKKKYGKQGHLHYNAPQCTPLWLYAPVQCRRFVCYCSLEDGTFIEGIKVPRVEVSNMNCDCAREKCRTGSQVQCDGYGNYAEAIFSYSQEKDGQWRANVDQESTLKSVSRTGYEAAQPTRTTATII